jgi:hypothetical protein
MKLPVLAGISPVQRRDIYSIGSFFCRHPLTSSAVRINVHTLDGFILVFPSVRRTESVR